MSRPRRPPFAPRWAIEGGRVTIEGAGFPGRSAALPEVRDRRRAARASSTRRRRRSACIVPGGLEGGRRPIRVDGVPGETRVRRRSRAPFATGLHQVDNPVFDRDGNLYVTYSGTRGQQVPVSIFRVRPNGTRETFSSGIVNPTSMAIDRRRAALRVEPLRRHRLPRRAGRRGRAVRDATSASRAAWRSRPDGTLFVGDRSGTIFRVDRSGKAEPFASLPPSVAAFHLAIGPDGVALRHGADAVDVRPDLSGRAGRDGDDASTCDSAGRRGSRSTPTASCSSSRRWPARAGSTGCRRADRRSWCWRAPISSASRSTRSAASSCARTTPRTD